jgi:hypothetical protein
LVDGADGLLPEKRVGLRETNTVTRSVTG